MRHRCGHLLTLLGVVLLVASLAGLVVTGAAAAANSPAAYQWFYGDTHAHTSVSDGMGTPAGAFASAKAAGMDFFMLTDHRRSIKASSWAETSAAADAATGPAFVAVAAYELNNWYQHVNAYNVAELMPWREIDTSRKAPGIAFVDPLLAYAGAIGSFNHPTWSGGTNFDDFVGRTPERDAVMSTVEVYNWGDGWDATFCPDSYPLCLDAGWHVMPSAVSDAHEVDWDAVAAPYEFRTVLLAPALTRADLFAALRANRGYATLDGDLRVSFTVDGAVMGSILSPRTRYTVAATVSDPDVLVAGDRVTRLDLVSDGGAVVASKAVNAHSVSWSLPVTSATARYYFLRVTTGDGVTAWTAPVWTGR